MGRRLPSRQYRTIITTSELAVHQPRTGCGVCPTCLILVAQLCRRSLPPSHLFSSPFDRGFHSMRGPKHRCMSGCPLYLRTPVARWGWGSGGPHKGGHRSPNNRSNADSADLLVSPASLLAVVGVFEHWRWGGCTQRAKFMP